MSNDIFYTNLSNLVTFYMGERPSADKFNAVNKYFSRGMRELAAAIGDINDDGFPYIGEGGGLGPSWNVSDGGKSFRPLDIVSIARTIGPTSNLNARMHLNYGQIKENIQELIPEGVVKYELLHPCNADIDPSISGYYFVPNSTEFFNNPNRFKILNERELIFSSPVEAGGKTVSYWTEPGKYYGGIDYQNAGFNVIPDPNQTNGVQIISLGDRRYKITFPVITAQQSSLSELKDVGIDASNEFNNAKNYELPKFLINSILDSDGNIIVENRIIPGNFLYLKNRRTQEVYKDAVYEYESPTELIVSNIDLCAEDDGISYSSTDYCIILTGANITNALDDLRLKWFKHSHDGTFGESPIQFKSLVGKFTETPPSGIYGPSSNEWNQMPMYLHRDGYVEDSNLNNGSNAMRGDLALALVDFDPFAVTSGNLLHGSGNSHKIFFGGLATFICRGGSTLEIINDTGSLYAYTSEQMHLKTEYSFLIETEGQQGQDLIIRNNTNDITLESSKNIKATNLNNKEYLNIDTVEKNVTLNEGFVIREYVPNDLILETQSKRVPKEEWANKKVILKEGVNVKQINHSEVAFNPSGSNTSFSVNQNGYIINSFYNNKFKNEAVGGTTVYSTVDLTNNALDDRGWMWSDGNEISCVLKQLPTITDVRRQVYPGISQDWGSVLTLNNPTSMNCSYSVNLYTEVTVEHLQTSDPSSGILTDLNDDGSVKDTAIIIPNGSYAETGLGQGAVANTNNLPIIKYHVVEINRSLNLARMEIDSKESIQNVFYFKINLPNGHDVPLVDSNLEDTEYDKSQFGRFLIRFDYGGYSKTIEENGISKEVYVSSNPAYSNPSENLLFLNLIDGINVVTLNGKALSDSDGIAAGMHDHIAGPNDAYPIEQPMELAFIRRSREGFANGIIARSADMASLTDGSTGNINDFIDYVFPNFTPPIPENDFYSVENIKNEYKKTTFTSNQFRANKWYKVEEEIFRKKVFLKITG